VIRLRLVAGFHYDEEETDLNENQSKGWRIHDEIDEGQEF
jgi:hypothetical protein